MNTCQTPENKIENIIKTPQIDSTGSTPKANQSVMYFSTRLIDNKYAVMEPGMIPVPFDLQEEYSAWEMLSDEALINFENDLKDEKG